MPTTSEAAIKKFKKRLIEHSAEQHSKFVSYDPDSGEWVFDVEHFSRYGLGDDSDEDRESEDEDSCIDIVGLGLGTARQFQDVADASPVIEVALHYGTGDVSNSLEDVMADRITESRVEDAASDDWIAVDMSRTDHSQLGIQDGVMSNSLPHSLPANLRHDVQKLEGVHSTMVGKHSSLHPSGKMESSLFKVLFVD